MTTDEAYSILGVPSTSTIADIEQAYKDRLHKLQLQLLAGQSLSLRRRAQGQIALLASAWEVLQKQASQSHNPPPGSSQGPLPRPVSPSPSSLPAGQRNWPGFTSLAPLPKSAIITSFVIAALVMLALMLLCFSASAKDQGKTQKASVSVTANTVNKGTDHVTRQDRRALLKREPARLRVLSVPWCEVAIDGKAFGSSGQAKAFELSEGRHELVLRRNEKVLTRSIRLYGGQQVVVKVLFEQGDVRAIRQ